jgi:hypothetical protein
MLVNSNQETLNHAVLDQTQHATSESVRVIVHLHEMRAPVMKIESRECPLDSEPQSRILVIHYSQMKATNRARKQKPMQDYPGAGVGDQLNIFACQV